MKNKFILIKKTDGNKSFNADYVVANPHTRATQWEEPNHNQ